MQSRNLGKVCKEKNRYKLLSVDSDFRLRTSGPFETILFHLDSKTNWPKPPASFITDMSYQPSSDLYQ